MFVHRNAMNIRPLFVTLLLFATLGLQIHATTVLACEQVQDKAEIVLDPDALKSLQKIGIGRKEVFASLIMVSVPETNGCWGGATGNFDEQLLSAGVLQWNLGTGSLQELLDRFRAKFATEALFDAEVSKYMKNYGAQLFSLGCRHYINKGQKNSVTGECRDFILARQNASGRLAPDFKEEVERLFESPVMVQLQVDKFLQTLTSVQSELMRLFPNQTPSERQIKWAVDTKVQQGVFPVDSDVLRMRKRVGEATFNRKVVNLTDVLLWYQSLCDSLDQDGVKLDCCVNTEVWPKMIRTNNSSPAQSELFSEQADLLMLSHLRSRVAYTQSGLYEALTFQRRAKIVLGVGSVAGRRDGPIDRSVLRKCNI